MSHYETCKRCRGCGVIDVRHGTVYITDDDEERKLAYHEETCPVCNGFRSEEIKIKFEAVVERAEKAAALEKELVEALQRARDILLMCSIDCAGTPTERFFQDAANDATAALARAAGTAETKA